MFPCVGDVRGRGLVHAVEIVNNQEERLPAPGTAEEIMLGLKTRQVLVAITGRDRNVILITPPMCFNMTNGQVLVQAFIETITELYQNQDKFGNKRPSVIKRVEDLEADLEDERETLLAMD